VREKSPLFVLFYAILVIFSVVTVLPVYLMMIGGFKTQNEIMTEPLTLPLKVEVSESLRWSFIKEETPIKAEDFQKRFNLKRIPFYKKLKEIAKDEEQLEEMKNYIAPFLRIGNILLAIKKGKLLTNLLVSMIVVLGSVFVLSLAGGMAAFPLAKLQYRSFTFIFTFFILGLTLPRLLGLCPLYVMMMNLGLLGNPLALILIYGGTRMPVTIVLFSTFYKTIPRALEDAAAIDGLNKIGYYFRILLPLSKIPILMTFVISGTFAFNDYLTPLIFLDNPVWTTVQVGISHFVGSKTWFFGPIFAGCTIAVLPMLIIYLLMNKIFITGLSSGAVKG